MIEAQAERIAEIRKRLDSIEASPWHYQEDSDAYTHIIRGNGNDYIAAGPQGSWPQTEINARFIAAAPEDIKYLLSLISES